MPVYGRRALLGDLPAGLGVAAVTIPQAIAIASLAGLPLPMALSALVLPALVYAWLGTAAIVSVGPVYLLGLLTLQVAGTYATPGTDLYVGVAAALALETALWFTLLRLLRVGDSANILSRAVIGGVINGAAIVIIVGELPVLLGATDTSVLPSSLIDTWRHLQMPAFGIGSILFAAAALGLLALAGPRRDPRSQWRQWLPSIVLIVGIVLHNNAGLALWGNAVLNADLGMSLPASALEVPTGAFMIVPLEIWLGLLPITALFAAAAYYQSHAVASELPPSVRRHAGGHDAADREFLALGAANLLAGLGGSMPVAASPSRTQAAVNLGARSLVSALTIAVCALLTTAVLLNTNWELPVLPLAVIAVWYSTQLFNFTDIQQLWRFNRVDAYTHLLTILVVIVFGVAVGLVVGLITALAAYIQRSAHPDLTPVGMLPDGTSYRSLARFDDARTTPGILSVRLDGNIYFANAGFVEARIAELLSPKYLGLAHNPAPRHLILTCQAVNNIDVSGLLMLERVTETLARQGIKLHLADLKTPLRRQLDNTRLARVITGTLFSSLPDALAALEAGGDERTAPATT